MFSERRTEIERMIKNEFVQRKDKLIKELENSKDAQKYLDDLKNEEKKNYEVRKAIERYYE